jgi:hypothetical protein
MDDGYGRTPFDDKQLPLSGLNVRRRTATLTAVRSIDQ